MELWSLLRSYSKYLPSLESLGRGAGVSFRSLAAACTPEAAFLLDEGWLGVVLTKLVAFLVALIAWASCFSLFLAVTKSIVIDGS